MRLATFLPPGGATRSPARSAATTVVAFADGSTVLDRLASGDRTPADGDAFALADVELLAPVARPRAIFGIGLNYAAHVKETGGTLPEAPIVFMKLPSSAAAPNAPISAPAVVRRLDYEGELAVVMGAGRRGRGLRRRRRRLGARPAAARAAVDPRQGLRRLVPVRARGSRPPTRSATRTTWRCAPGSTASCARTRRTSDLIFDVPELVAFLRETLHARARRPDPHRHAQRRRHGDGPAAVPAPGDVVRIEIERLGSIQHAVA